MPEGTSTGRWRQLEDILSSSWRMPADQREAYWARCAAGDEALLRELRELSAAKERADRWSGASAAEAAEAPPRRIGPYELEHLIGRGGMGAVYLAHRAYGEFDQRIALKLIGLPFEIEPFRELFRRERQILGGLSHPNIARLLDGGTTDDGELYLAMEYIDGVAIDRYAQGRSLSERLGLFADVCAGVEYAHQRLVVHRDIKPSNILVNEQGVPKLLDFGSAKLLAGAEVTRTGFGMITVAYASPEQLRGEAASTLSDVFALGVLLFELVAGRGAFGGDLTSRLADLKEHRDTPDLPERQPGDLDRVARKALAFDPAQRYSSAGQLAEDVRRFQAGEPVAAHPPSLAYRAGRFVRRHMIGVAVAVLIILLMATTSGALLQYIQTSNPIHREYLEEAVRLGRIYPMEVDSLARSASLQALAESYLAAPGSAEEHYRQAYPLIQEALTLDRADPSHGSQLLLSLESSGRINRFLGHYDQDEAAQREAYQLTIRLAGPDHVATSNKRAIWAISLTAIRAPGCRRWL
ncbi:MAG: serine/threonine protein kinase [Acidobacteriia bacterium]|nr:serine/threonine protein kinase [Terriglobia bacterium]